MDEENEVVKLLVKVGKNINKTEEQLRPFIKKIVEDNWLDSIESLKNLNDNEWYNLQLPLRLVDEIKKELLLRKEEDTKTYEDKNKDDNNNNNNNNDNNNNNNMMVDNRYDEIIHGEENQILNCNKKLKKNLKEEKEHIINQNTFCTNIRKENITHSNNINNHVSCDYDNKRTSSHYTDHNKSSKLINDMNVSRDNIGVYENTNKNKKEGFNYSIIKYNKDILENMINKQTEDIKKEDIFYLSHQDDYPNNYDNYNNEYSYSEEKTRTINSINACEKLKKIPMENLKVVLPILCKIVKNILINPNILNTRILKSTNNIMKNKILIYQEIKNLLLCIGFVEIYIFYVMIKVDTLLLLCIYESLKNISKNIIKIDDSSNLNFDPFKSNIVCVDTLKKKKNLFHVNDNVDILLKQKKEQMEKLMNQPIEKNPKIYKQKKNYSESQESKENNKKIKKKNHHNVLDAQEKDEEDAEHTEDEEDFSHIISNIRNFCKEQTFKSKTKLELEKISNAKVYSKTIIKILFPDDYILELSFSSGTLLRDVNEAVKGFLNDSIISKNWFLYETPGIRKFDPQKSLSFYNLMPHALLRFKLDQQDENFVFSSFLSNESIEKYLISS
ncbi:hypothetical protein C923_04364 [Plasmodium falciparum UGT5.1]|uniref:PUB domain-containing protein, putative n=8 Tax=Plasmodium falciparum TaxID=5833 RepID=Q8IES1_PLAF7|nr:PUB domain-containing protein, putative [Plasmodium falciparum 3D7]ETW17053.1 hypothetical protein PFFVO_03882 [Plasmodium falciparum Vietnam Oak-Knoll (FVO)]ETW29614.1 hypothetical protein PFFCH_02884 [Plasmodium falciparum FCH/4]ETW54857.1 hypothetical protein PFUGPA_03459 [Plasmodium falciparum Palo Alto/Uganda]ETW59783.1 hypothetical protein PFMC_04245 [Plasmodium falciparum CAMP/Malaysia]EWC74926.1 hypothetical protein C923_04364 [Plasmodium falciparum UGT5.1]EWC86933.1 hypothetical p|eukprot:XP_001349771.1 conserved Plasmodium protein, unknown function [Plasmodium falciparum 3D7]